MIQISVLDVQVMEAMVTVFHLALTWAFPLTGTHQYLMNLLDTVVYTK